MLDPDQHVIDNYRQIKDERGCSWSDLARDMDHSDPKLAAWMRGQDDGDQPAKRTQAPRGRRSTPQANASS